MTAIITDLSDDHYEINDICKTVMINNKLIWLQVYIAVLQETWLPELGSLCERESTLSSGREKGKDKIREYGVGFAVKNSKMVDLCKNRSE